MTFVPIRYLYPSRTSWMQSLTLITTMIWGVAIIALCLYPNADWAQRTAQLSLLYPVYYASMSFIYHQKITKEKMLTRSA